VDVVSPLHANVVPTELDHVPIPVHGYLTAESAQIICAVGVEAIRSRIVPNSLDVAMLILPVRVGARRSLTDPTRALTAATL
jgi:hypothetical protein